MAPEAGATGAAAFREIPPCEAGYMEAAHQKRQPATKPLPAGAIHIWTLPNPDQTLAAFQDR